MGSRRRKRGLGSLSRDPFGPRKQTGGEKQGVTYKPVSSKHAVKRKLSIIRWPTRKSTDLGRDLLMSIGVCGRMAEAMLRAMIIAVSQELLMWSRKFSLALLLLVAAVRNAQAADDITAVKAEELNRFQGTWIVASMDICEDICERRSSPEKETKFVVEGRTLIISAEHGMAGMLQFAIDPTKIPKELDLTVTVTVDGSQRIRRAIYEFERDTLKICFGALDGLDRPRDFTTVRKPYVTVVLRRAAE